VSARFAFRLARLLRHRRRIEDARALAVRQAIERHETARARQATLEAAASHARAALTGQCAGGVSGAWLRAHADTAGDLHGRARAAAILTAAEASRVEVCRTALIEAARDRRALERLEERQRAAWRTGLARAEQRTTDDIATTRHGRTSEGSL
jgi:flagellar export protein FliJ